MFRVGEKFVCVDCFGGDSFHYGLINGKTYTIEDVWVYNAPIGGFSIQHISIGCLSPINEELFNKKFVKLKEYRKQKLNRICLE